MAYREVSRVEIAEVVRRWQSGESQRQIASGTGLSRKTVRRYIRAGVEAGLTRDGPVPSEDQLTRLVGLTLCSPRKIETPTDEKLAPWADQVYAWLTADRLQVTRIHELLAARGCEVSYASVGRFIRRRGWQRRSATTVRMEKSAPGEVAEMDFGRLGLIEDPETGRRRAVWALIIVLTYSRHRQLHHHLQQGCRRVARALRRPHPRQQRPRPARQRQLPDRHRRRQLPRTLVTPQGSAGRTGCKGGG